MADRRRHGSNTSETEPVHFFLPRSNSQLKLRHVDPAYEPKLLKTYNTSIESDDLEPGNESRILVLYTGGTIGMRTHSGAYEPEPNYLVAELRKLPMFHDREYAEYHFTGEEEHQPLAMPVSKEGKRVIYYVCEYEPLLDSSNMTMTDYARIASDIEKNYDTFDGFVVLHGTDTMAYTASALSFMCEHLGKPVVLTGSQIPIFETRSDGRDNMLGALIIAGHYVIPEVTLYFNNKLMRGNRCVKKDAEGLDAFQSHNLPPLAEMEISIHVHWDNIYKPIGAHKFCVHTNLCPNVGLLRLFPSITEATVKAFLQPPMEGVVIQSYGAGNGPDKRKDLMRAFREATSKGIILVNITQCQRGVVKPTYGTGKSLAEAGIIPGSDMTPEAALTKLAYVLGKEDWSLEKRKKMMGVNMRGEMSVAIKEDFSLLDFSLIEHLAESMRLSSQEEIQGLRDAVFPSLLCAAAKNGDIATLDKLRESGGVLSSADYDGRTPLHVAATGGHVHVVRYLVENGALVHVRDQNGDSPLMSAIKKNHYPVIELLLRTGAHIMKAQHHVGIELCTSAYHGDVVNLRSWIKAGADINQGDYDKRTALHVAASHGNAEVVDLLLHHGADPDQLDSFGLRPMDEARSRGYTEVVAVLEQYQEQGAGPEK